VRSDAVFCAQRDASGRVTQDDKFCVKLRKPSDEVAPATLAESLESGTVGRRRWLVGPVGEKLEDADNRPQTRAGALRERVVVEANSPAGEPEAAAVILAAFTFAAKVLGERSDCEGAYVCRVLPEVAPAREVRHFDGQDRAGTAAAPDLREDEFVAFLRQMLEYVEQESTIEPIVLERKPVCNVVNDIDSRPGVDVEAHRPPLVGTAADVKNLSLSHATAPASYGSRGVFAHGLFAARGDGRPRDSGA
jgi:hypothetical protein